MHGATSEENMQILQPGISNSEHLELVHLPDKVRTKDDPRGPYIDAAPRTPGRPEGVDVMILHGCMQPDQAIVWREQYPDIPAIIMDYKDEQRLYHPDARVMAHFKRNMAIRVHGKPLGIFNYAPKNVQFSPYCVRLDIVEAFKKINVSRDIDVSCFFEPKDNCHVDALERELDRGWDFKTSLGRNLGFCGTRVLVATTLKNSQQWFHSGLKMHIGKTGTGQTDGRRTPQQEYVELMARSKIIVSATPDGWEGDYRLMEALSSSALVLHNRMILPPAGLEDGKHWVIYNDHMDMLDKVNYYSARPELAKKIGEQGRKYVMNNHQPHHRVESWLRAVNIL